MNVVEFPFKWDEWRDKVQAVQASQLDNELTMIFGQAVCDGGAAGGGAGFGAGL